MGDVIDLAEHAAKKLQRERVERWRPAFAPEISRARPPIAYVCRDLALAPGVSIFGGGGFSGKTTSLQSLMLSIVSGQLAWGHFDVEQGDVGHVDFEQGPDLTYLKYQRMARHMGIDLEGLGERLMCSSLPRGRLNDSRESADELRWLFEGRKAGIIDAFRGAFPDAQENDSGARKYLDMVHGVALEIGCAIVVIAHSRKLTEELSDARSSLRGTGALFDAPQTVWMLSGTRDKPTKCENTKERLRGKLKESFGLIVEDVLGPGLEPETIDDEWGLSVRYLSPSEVQAAFLAKDGGDENSLSINSERIISVGVRIVDLLRSAPNGLTLPTIKGLLHSVASSADIAAAMPMMIDTGDVRIDGPIARAIYHAGREPGQD